MRARALSLSLSLEFLPSDCTLSTGFFEIDTGLRISQVAEEGSYQYDFASLLESEFLMFSGYVVTRSDDFPAAQRVRGVCLFAFVHVCMCECVFACVCVFAWVHVWMWT